MAQRAEAEGRKSYRHPCTIARTLDVLGDRWTLLVLRDLMAGLQRYSDILDNCGGMSPNVLADRLKRLESAGLVRRDYYRALPPRVEYSLTEKGWAVRPVLLSLIEWGQHYLDPVEPSAAAGVSTDFSVRTVSAFAFKPELADGLSATMVVEVSDCADCNTWSFEIEGGQIRPRRQDMPMPDVRLRTTAAGFFRFIRGEAAPEVCGDLEGPAHTAARIQSCFELPR